MSIGRLILALCGAMVAWTCAQSSAHAAFPERPVKLIIAYAAGGTSDVIARVLAKALEKSLGVPFVVENRPGGNGIIAAEAVMQSPPDGHTLWIADTGHFAINPVLLPKLPYDPLKNFVPITQVTRQDFYLVVNKTFPANNVAEMLALAKSRAGGLSYGSVGTASVHNLGFERIKLQSGTNLVHIPYKGNAELKPALLAGWRHRHDRQHHYWRQRRTRSRDIESTRLCRRYTKSKDPQRADICRSRSRGNRDRH